MLWLRAKLRSKKISLTSFRYKASCQEEKIRWVWQRKGSFLVVGWLSDSVQFSKEERRSTTTVSERCCREGTSKCKAKVRIDRSSWVRSYIHSLHSRSYPITHCPKTWKASIPFVLHATNHHGQHEHINMILQLFVVVFWSYTFRFCSHASTPNVTLPQSLHTAAQRGEAWGGLCGRVGGMGTHAIFVCRNVAGLGICGLGWRKPFSACCTCLSDVSVFVYKSRVF